MDDNILIALPEQANLQLPDPNLLNYYNDIKERIYWINGEITEDTLDLIQYIILWNREDRGKDVKDRKPIRIFINSVGGVLDVAETITSIIQLSNTPVYAMGLGLVASAASLIYLSCHRRFALPNATFLIHKGSCSNIGGGYNEVMAAMNDYRKQIDKMINFYISHTEFPEEIIRKNIESDWYVDIEEGVKYNIVTDLIEDIDILL